MACKQIGCGHAVSAPTGAHFGRGSGPIWLDNVACTGEESAITHCTHNGFGINNCGHGEDASVICLGKRVDSFWFIISIFHLFVLVIKNYVCTFLGSLQKPQITVHPGPEVIWGEKLEITCTVAPEHLGGMFVLKNTQGTFVKEKFSDHEAATFIFPSADFSLKGSYFCEYHKKLPNQIIYYPQGNTADISVTGKRNSKSTKERKLCQLVCVYDNLHFCFSVKLEKPSISLTSPHSMVMYSPQKISIPKGSSFSITCSTHSRYSSGIFYLRNVNTNTSEEKESFGHSIFYMAYFEFPEVDLKHQGEYSCIYGINISSQPFRSLPSKTLQVSVVGKT